jgi:hypothetical protein
MQERFSDLLYKVKINDLSNGITLPYQVKEKWSSGQKLYTERDTRRIKNIFSRF